MDATYVENVNNWIKQQESCIEENNILIEYCERLIETNVRLNKNYINRIKLLKRQSEDFNIGIAEQQMRLIEYCNE